jgi:hypothetical protein
VRKDGEIGIGVETGWLVYGIFPSKSLNGLASEGAGVGTGSGA